MNEPDLVAEAIELCDFQPSALLSCADRAADEGLARTVERLRPDHSRLDMLRYGGRDVAERFASEYSNLEDLERRAFLLLTIPESGSFVPWALQPLLGIGSAEAGNLMASISKGGLLEHQGRDPSGFGRYRFSSLSRLLAEQQLRNGDVPPEEVEQAREDFRRAYMASAMKVFSHLGVVGMPPLAFPVPGHWYPQVGGWEGRVADNLDYWVRAEFGCVVRVVQDAAASGQPALCWQIAARLGDCYSPPVRHADVRLAFENALNAARENAGREAEISVRLAAGGYLASVHRYDDAIAELKAAAGLATAPGDQAAAAEAFRRLAHAWQETGHYDRALEALQDGHSASAHAGNCEARLLGLLLSENEAVRQPGQWAHQPSVDGLRSDPRDNSRFLEKVILGRVARRRRDVGASRELLDAARQFADGDVARHADIEYEQAATRMHLAPFQTHSPPPPDTRSLVAIAAQAIRSSDRLDSPHAQAQARCALAHAMILAGQSSVCLKYLDAADQILQLMPSADAERLRAHAQRLRGEALLRSHDPCGALIMLELARQWLAPRESWSYAEVMVLVGNAHRQLRQFMAALAAHATAAEIFTRNRDSAAASYALSEFSTTLRAAGGGPVRSRWVRRVIGRT